MFLKSAALLLIGCGLFAAGFLCATPENISASGSVLAAGDDGRESDRKAILAHIDKIFRAYADGDCATIRATHAPDWIGFTGQARSIVRGLDAYMNTSAGFCRQNQPRSPEALARGGLAGYKLTEVDFLFQGDVALVPYVAETWYGRAARVPGKLRSLDVYAKVNGEWTQIGSNIFPHPDMLEAQRQQPAALQPPARAELLAAREAVWRAYFSHDREQLERLIPEEAVAVNDSGGQPLIKRAEIMEGAKKMGEGGARLVRLDFPQTETQVYGDTAILYTTYSLELEDAQGRRSARAGRGVEIFVRRKGGWVNAGWHLQTDR